MRTLSFTAGRKAGAGKHRGGEAMRRLAGRPRAFQIL
jgi:hypothetical protein